MCNEAARRITPGLLREVFSQLKIPLKFPEGAPNMARLDGFRITGPTVRAAAAEAQTLYALQIPFDRVYLEARIRTETVGDYGIEDLDE